VLEYQSDRGSAVVCQMNFGNSDPATSLTTNHAVVLDQTLRDVSLAHRRTYNASTMTRGDNINRTRRRNIRDNHAGFPSQTNLSSDGERHLLGERLAQVADDSQALAIGVMGETDGGAASLHNRT